MIDPDLARASFEALCLSVASSVGFFVAYGTSGSVVVAGLTTVFLASMFAYVLLKTK